VEDAMARGGFGAERYERVRLRGPGQGDLCVR